MDTLGRGRDLARIGLLTLTAVVVFTGMFLWLTGRTLGADRSTLYVHFDSADRLKRGDPVLFRGVPVGEVRKLTFDREGVLVQTRLDREVPAHAGAIATLRAVDVFGAQSVVLTEGDVPGARLAGGDTIRGHAGTDLAGRVETLSDRASELVGPRTVHQVHSSLENIAAAAVELQRTLAESRTLMASQGDALSATMANMAATTANLREVSSPEELRATLANMEATSENLVELSTRLSGATASLESLLAKVDTGQGTAGRLLNDPALYDRLLATTYNLDALLKDLRENPGRYVRLSVF